MRPGGLEASGERDAVPVEHARGLPERPGQAAVYRIYRNISSVPANKTRCYTPRDREESGTSSRIQLVSCRLFDKNFATRLALGERGPDGTKSVAGIP